MDGDFLQSKEWEGFQKKFHRRVFRVGEILTIERRLPFGKKWWYTPRTRGNSKSCPEQSRGIEYRNPKELLEHFDKNELPVFWKIENINPDGLKFKKKKSASRQPEKTLVLDLTQSAKEILTEMHQKTRYNIHLAEKKEVEVSADNQKIDAFLKLMAETTNRDQFSAHSDEYYHKMVEMLPVQVWLAKHEKNVLAGAIVLYFKDTAYYLHGASSNQDRNLMAPYLLHWRIIEDAQKKGLKIYDFWGIDEKKWSGVTRFKRGFGGEEVDYKPAFDLIFQPVWYRIYLAYRWLKKIV